MCLGGPVRLDDEVIGVTSWGLGCAQVFQELSSAKFFGFPAELSSAHKNSGRLLLFFNCGLSELSHIFFEFATYGVMRSLSNWCNLHLTNSAKNSTDMF